MRNRLAEGGGKRKSESEKISALVFLRTKKDIAGMGHGKIPKPSSICTNNVFTVDNASPRSGILHTSYPANSARTDSVVGIMNLICSLRLMRKYIFPNLFTE